MLTSRPIQPTNTLLTLHLDMWPQSRQGGAAMTPIEAFNEAMNALINSETLCRQCAQESFIAERDKKYWLQAADRAKKARQVLVDVLLFIEQEKSDVSI